MDRKEIVISNVTCSEQVQILTLFVSSNLACELSFNKIFFQVFFLSITFLKSNLIFFEK